MSIFHFTDFLSTLEVVVDGIIKTNEANIGINFFLSFLNEFSDEMCCIFEENVGVVSIVGCVD